MTDQNSATLQTVDQRPVLCLPRTSPKDVYNDAMALKRSSGSVPPNEVWLRIDENGNHEELDGAGVIRALRLARFEVKGLIDTGLVSQILAEQCGVELSPGAPAQGVDALGFDPVPPVPAPSVSSCADQDVPPVEPRAGVPFRSPYSWAVPSHAPAQSLRPVYGGVSDPDQSEANHRAELSRLASEGRRLAAEQAGVPWSPREVGVVDPVVSDLEEMSRQVPYADPGVSVHLSQLEKEGLVARREAELLKDAARVAEEKARVIEESRLAAVEAERVRQEELARLRAEEEARVKAEADRLAAVEAERVRQEELARLRAEEEARVKAEADRLVAV